MGRNKIDLSNADWSKPIVQIAAENKCSYATVCLYSKQHGIKAVNNQSKFQDTLAAAKDWDWKNKDLSTLAEENGISYAMCGVIQRRLGVKAKRKPVKGSESSIAATVCDEELASTCDSDIAKRYNCSRELIRQIRVVRKIDGPWQKSRRVEKSDLKLSVKDLAAKYGRAEQWARKKKTEAGTMRVPLCRRAFDGFNWNRKVSEIMKDLQCNYNYAARLRGKFAPDMKRERRKRK